MPHLDEATNVLLGESKAISILRDQIVKASTMSAHVLIHGPVGAGKEITARAIHAASRRYGPFVSMNVSQTSEFISRSTEWDDAWGTNVAFSAYTVMSDDCHGMGDGTVFLKEIGQLQPSSQVLLLHALKGRLFQPTSDNSSNSFRIISATNVHPKHLLEERHFRESLLRRLGSVTITVPSLVQRYKDIPVLAMYFLSKLPEAGRPLGCTAAAMRRLQEYDWPGNVRELQRVITAAAMLAPDAMLDEMAITFALNTVDRVRNVSPASAESRPCNEESDRSAPQTSIQSRGAVPNHLAKRTISYELSQPERLGRGVRTLDG